MNNRTLIKVLGGIALVSERTGAKPSAVSNWGLSGRQIPWKHKPEIAKLAAEQAVSLPLDFWGN